MLGREGVQPTGDESFHSSVGELVRHGRSLGRFHAGFLGQGGRGIKLPGVLRFDQGQPVLGNVAEGLDSLVPGVEKRLADHRRFDGDPSGPVTGQDAPIGESGIQGKGVIQLRRHEDVPRHVQEGRRDPDGFHEGRHEGGQVVAVARLAF